MSLFAYRAPQLLSLLDGKIVADENISFFVEGDSHDDAFRVEYDRGLWVWPFLILWKTLCKSQNKFVNVIIFV